MSKNALSTLGPICAFLGILGIHSGVLILPSALLLASGSTMAAIYLYLSLRRR